MGRGKETIDDEQRSYSAVFLLGVGMLLIGAIWTVWDDNISRRPWKQYQLEFSELQIERARQAIADEEARLAQDPKYQEVTKALAEAQRNLADGETARQIAAAERAEAAARVEVDDQDLALRIVKSKLEEGWYEYEHALLSGASTDAPRAHIAKLEKDKADIQAALAQAEAQMQQYTNQIAEIRSVAQNLDKERRDLEKEKDRLEQRLSGMVIKLGPVDLPTIPKIQQVVLNEFDRNPYDQPVARVDRCQSCHAGIEKAGFEKDPEPYSTHPARAELLGKHPTEKFGCTPCHGGQGAAVNSPAMAHGEVKHWEHPLLRGDLVQASCPGCHLNLRLPHAETIARGELLFEHLGCVGCHLLQGYGDLPRPGPSLRRLGAKVNADWLVSWIENPKGFRPRTRMPIFGFSRQQASAVAAFLLSTTQRESGEWLAAAHDAPAAVNPGSAAQVAKGRALADSLGCRGCHGFAPDEAPARLGHDKDIAPNLSNIAEKTDAQWLYNWLKSPRGYSAEARMPSLRLSDDEAAALASYLLTLGTPKGTASANGSLQSPELVKEGEALVRKYGCAGCHNIPGMEQESRIGVELTTFGSKPLEEFFFGNRTDIPVTWYDWTYNKLKEPRIYATERIEQVMPQFNLADEDVQALIVFLKSRTEHKTPAEYKPRDMERERKLVDGRRVAERYNCVGCHVVEGQGGAIRAFYEESPTMAPPILNGEGAKVQPNWLFGFLQAPVPLRPWLKVRMPTFGLSEQDTNTLVEYFLAQDKVQIPFVYVNDQALPPDYVEAGKQLASPEYFNCFSCHQQGDKKPEGPEEGWAPDLALARHRLNPDWIVKWLYNPQTLQPGTKMPSFYNFEDDVPDGPEDILGGKDEEQIKALRDYVLMLHQAINEGKEPAMAGAQSAQADPAGEDQM